MVLLSTATIALSLCIIGVFLLITANVHQAVRRLQEKVEIEVFLSDTVSPERRAHLIGTLQRMAVVQEAVYISKGQALQEADLDTAFIKAVGSNPLPASIRVRLKEGHRSAADIQTVLTGIENHDGIEEIYSGSQVAQQLDRSLFLLSLATAAVGLIFGLASILVISTTIQLTVFSRRETISIMQLVGATDGLIRGPFVLEGILQGTIGGLAAAAGLAGLHWIAGQELSWLVPLGPVPLAGLAIAGGLLGGFGSSQAVNRSLAECSPF
jgi:cell division transport system permease protein